MLTCSIEQCERPAKITSMCTMHYHRARRGKPMDAAPRQVSWDGAECTVASCSRPVKAKGLCGKHHKRRLKGQELDPLPPVAQYCAAVNCEDRVSIKGLCSFHYRRTRDGVPLDAPRIVQGLSDEERFWSHVDRRGPDECWEWTARRNRQGYGQFHVRRGGSRYRFVSASRFAFELTHGKSPDHWALHHCDNPPCCNPVHIYDGTPAQNSADCVKRGRRGWTPEAYAVRDTARGSRSGMAKLTEQAVVEIRARYAAGGVSQQSLADEYGVNQTKISAIVRGETWKHVPMPP